MAREAGKGRNGSDAKGQLGFEADLFKAADKLRGNMEPSDYKHVALGLIFLKHISDSFEAKRAALLANYPDGAEDPDEYAAENVFWVPKEARWSHLQANAKLPSIGKMIDEAMIAIEKRNETLKGVLPKDYARPALNAVMLGELIDLISGIALGQEKGEARDVLGRVYEYFLGQFAGSEGKRGGEFYTPRSVVRVMVEMIEPYKGRVYDPCCGSGGMFVQSEKFALEHEGRIGDIAIYGQESNYTTWRLCKMNLAVRGIDAEIKWNSEGSFHKDELRDLKADFILANPPFNISDWGGDRLREDVRWKYGMRGLFRWAKESKYVSIDPTSGVKNPKKPKGRGFPAWTEQDVEAYQRKWPIGTRQRVWLDVLLYTGPRRGDVVKIGRQNECLIPDPQTGEMVLWINFKTEKGGEKIEVSIPVLPILQATLANGPCGDLTYICGERGNPLSKESFGNMFSAAAREAGVNKSAHGVRKIAAVTAANNGATVHQLMALFGWKTSQMAEYYTREANRRRLARQGVHTLVRTPQQLPIPAPSHFVPLTSKKGK